MILFLHVTDRTPTYVKKIKISDIDTKRRKLSWFQYNFTQQLQRIAVTFRQFDYGKSSGNY